MARIRNARERLRRNRSSRPEGPPASEVSSALSTPNTAPRSFTDEELRRRGRGIQSTGASLSRLEIRASRERRKQVEARRREAFRERARVGKLESEFSRRGEAIPQSLRDRRARADAVIQETNQTIGNPVGETSPRIRQLEQSAQEARGRLRTEVRTLGPDATRRALRLQPRDFNTSEGRTIQRASVASPTLGVVGAGEAATTSVPTRTPISPSRSVGTGATAAAINNIVSFDARAQQERELEADIARSLARSEAAQARSERARDVFRAIPGLRGDNLAQTNIRGALALPGTIGPEIGASVAQAADRGRIAFRAIRQDRRAARELTSAARETPRAVGQAFDPRGPEGITNIAAVATLGVFGLRAGLRNPVRTRAGTGDVIRARVPIGSQSASITEVRPLAGISNRIAGRQATVTTRVNPQGTVTQTTITPGGLRVTDTLRQGAPRLQRTITGRGSRRVLQVRTGTPGTQTLDFSRLGQTRRLVQRETAQLAQNRILQRVVQREGGLAIGGIGSRGNIGTLTRQTRQTTVSVLPETDIIQTIRARDLGTGRPLAAAKDATTFQRSLRLGDRTSPGRVIRGRQERLDVDLGVREVTQLQARTPRPRSIIKTEQGLDFVAPRPGPRRTLSGLGRGRRGSQQNVFRRPDTDFLSRIREPFNIGRARRPGVGRGGVTTPRLRTPRSRPSAFLLGGSALLAGGGRAAPQRAIPAARTRPGRAFDIRPAETPAIASSTAVTPALDTRQRSRTTQRTRSATSAATGSASLSLPAFTSPGLAAGGGGFGFFLPPGRRSRGGFGQRTSRSRTSFTRGLADIEGLRGLGPDVTSAGRSGLFGFENRRRRRRRR